MPTPTESDIDPAELELLQDLCWFMFEDPDPEARFEAALVCLECGYENLLLLAWCPGAQRDGLMS